MSSLQLPRRTNAAAYIAGLLSGCLMHLQAAAQTQGAAPPPAAARAPMAIEDPLHHTVFLNEFVRAFRVVIAPGDRTTMHMHDLDYALLMVSGSRMGGEWSDRPGREWNSPTGALIYFPFGKKQEVHRMINVDPSSLNHQFAFELLQPGPVGFGVSDRTSAPAYKQEIDNDRLRAWRLKLEPGRSAEVIIQRAPGLRIYLSGDRVLERRGSGPAQEITVAAGDFAWLPGGAIRRVVNVGTKPLEFVEVELK